MLSCNVWWYRFIPLDDAYHQAYDGNDYYLMDTDYLMDKVTMEITDTHLFSRDLCGRRKVGSARSLELQMSF